MMTWIIHPCLSLRLWWLEQSSRRERPDAPAATLITTPRRTLILLALLLALSAEAETLAGKVVGVTDGDTITVLVAERPIKVRLAEIDTPERGQPWASRAKQALSDKVFRKEVDVRVLNLDRYGRTVGHVWIGDRHINREMVREGHAWVYRKYLDDITLLNDEIHAQTNKLGLWSLPEAQRVPPWDLTLFRKNGHPLSYAAQALVA